MGRHFSQVCRHVCIVLTSVDIPDKNIILVTSIITYNLKNKVSAINPVQQYSVQLDIKKIQIWRVFRTSVR